MKRLVPIAIPESLLGLRLRRTSADAPYLRAYPHLVAALAGRCVTPSVFVEAAHMVYGWMPTVLALSPRNPQQPFVAEAVLVECVRGGGALFTADELGYLASSMTDKDGSVIGLSKLLHFVCPNRYAIWDTRVYAFLRHPGSVGPIRKPDYATVNRVGRYVTYLKALQILIETESDFKPFHQRVTDDLEYEVSAMRAAEVVMFSNAPAFITKVR